MTKLYLLNAKLTVRLILTLPLMVAVFQNGGPLEWPDWRHYATLWSGISDRLTNLYTVDSGLADNSLILAGRQSVM